MEVQSQLGLKFRLYTVHIPSRYSDSYQTPYGPCLGARKLGSKSCSPCLASGAAMIEGEEASQIANLTSDAMRQSQCAS